VNYFEFMGIPQTMCFDPKALEKAFYTLSRQYHPDLQQGRGDKEKVEALEKSALLNKAYTTLKDPLLRAAYLINLEAPVPEKERIQVDTGLVSEIFEIQEKVEEEKRTKNPTLRSELLDAQKEVEEKITRRIATLQDAFKAWDALGEERPKKEALAREIYKALDEITYLKNVIQSIQTGRVTH